MIRIVWEFRVRKGMEREFESRYSSYGAWARLFAKSDGYGGTTLMRDAASFAAFKQAQGNEYAALDKDCEALTEAEVHVGTFETFR